MRVDAGAAFKMRGLQKGAIFILWLVAVLLAALPAAAQDAVEIEPSSFSVSVRAVNSSILFDGQAIFDVVIGNPSAYSDTFRISVPDVEWGVQSEPLYHYFSGVDVPAFGTVTVRLLLKPVAGFSPGIRAVNLEIKSVSTGKKQEISTFVNIRSRYPLIMEYLAAVGRIVDIPARIDPRNEFVIRVNLINRNPKNISALKVVLSSVSTGVIREEIDTTLNPFESKAVSARVKLDPLTHPVQDTLKVVLSVNGQPLEPTIFEKFEVISYSEIKPVKSERKGSFLKWVNETTYVNEGNVKGVKVIEEETSLLGSLFLRSSPKSFTIAKGGKRFNAWELSLEPSGQVTIRVVRSYQPVLWLLLLALAGFVIYRFMRSSVQLIKEASAISYREGGVSELKVVLRVSNRSSNPYVKLTVMDRVPMIAEVEHDSMGTLKPATVFNDGRGSVVKWELENLDRHEERILAYKIRLKLSVLGQFSLPKGSVRFYTEKNVKFVTKSNTVTIKP